MRKKTLRALELLLAVLLLLALFMIVRAVLDSHAARREYSDAASIAGLPSEFWNVPELPTQTSTPPPEEDQVPSEVRALLDMDMDALLETCGDLVGWILIPGTEISYPLLQADNNQYYLDRTWRGESSSSGAIFIDYRNDASLEGFNTIIYGHRMRDGSMFGSLKEYDDEDYWEEHPSVYIACGGKVYRYDIFSSFQAPVDGIVYEMNLLGREAEFIRYAQEHSTIDTGVVPAEDTRIITLSTCTGNGYAKRLVVMACLAEVYEK